jgi:hypothetical protein
LNYYQEKNQYKANYKVVSFYLSLFFILLLPSFFYVTLHLDSPTLGVIISLFAALFLNLKKVIFIKISMKLIVFSLLFGILLVFFTISAPSLKSLSSIFIFLFLLISVVFLHAILKELTNIEFYLSIRLVTITLLIIGYVGTFYHLTILNYELKPKSVFPFAEPSHFALVAGLIFNGFLLVASKKWQVFIILSIFLFGAFFPNLTIILYALLAILVFSRWYWSLFIFMLLILFIGLLFLYNSEVLLYYSSRVMLNSDSSNLTALVYMQGWQELWAALVETNGIGLGFQMNGTQIPTDIAEKIRSIAGIYKNRQDGAFLSSKLISEFGVVGILIVLLFMKYIITSFVFLKRESNKTNKNIKLVFCHGVVFSFSIELFFRSTGYFTSSLVILLLCVYYIKRNNVKGLSWKN